jgi:oligopeptide/dipeptide ABC transporter ATP-binding protein
LVDEPGRIVAGEIRFDGEALFELDEKEMTDLRGRKISMVFQQPLSSLNPVLTGGAQVSEVLTIHSKMNKEDAWSRAIELFQEVGIPDAKEKVLAYPHELSGGQAQRVMIAIALATRPDMLIADEPTTALDVTIQAQILDLLQELSSTMKTAVLLIAHDMGIIAEVCDRVAVMYAGRIVEQTDVDNLFQSNLHPYTQGLMDSIPTLGRVVERLDVIPGTVPNLIDLPPGCRFAPRCRARIQFELDICELLEPDLKTVLPDHKVRCWLYQDHENHKAPKLMEE